MAWSEMFKPASVAKKSGSRQRVSGETCKPQIVLDTSDTSICAV